MQPNAGESRSRRLSSEFCWPAASALRCLAGRATLKLEKYTGFGECRLADLSIVISPEVIASRSRDTVQTGRYLVWEKENIHWSAQFRAIHIHTAHVHFQGRGRSQATLFAEQQVAAGELSWSKRPEHLCFEGFWNNPIRSMQVPGEPC